MLAYLTEDPDDPIVFFHLWNGTWPPERDEAVILAVRFGDGPFSETFTYTRRRPPQTRTSPITLRSVIPVGT
ncbi:hypothetical protein GCM10010191_62130 [Actinomadura vinacea]|uniref:Uncharacterized protein n=1 Tax=Actinomadura vinacea TaxID=115336 RepID=A0ABN3JRS1_9ACTN